MLPDPGNMHDGQRSRLNCVAFADGDKSKTITSGWLVSRHFLARHFLDRQILDRHFLDNQNLAVHRFLPGPTLRGPSVPGSSSTGCTLPISVGQENDGPGSVI